MEAKKMIIFSTVDPKKDSEKSSMAFAIGVTALASEVEADMFFTLDGVHTVTKDYVKNVDSGGYFPPMQELLDAFIENGGKLFICQPSMIKRKIKPEDLIEQVEVVSAPAFVNDAMGGNIVSL